jgi:2-aminoethylphosphonate-pyruvate transaminase
MSLENRAGLMPSQALDLEKKKLFTPGPVMVPDEVRRVANEPDIGHRRPQFEAILDSVRGKLRRLYRASEEYTTAVVSGSGTAANETVINSMSDRTYLLIENGEFGGRLAEIMRRHDVDHTVLSYDWGRSPDVDEIESVVAERDVDVVAMTYHETSTAMINPVSAVGSICADRDVTFYVDAISAVGSEPIDVVAEDIDVITGVSNKAVSSITGCSFVCLRRDLLADVKDEADVVYLDLKKHVRYAEERSQTPNTPAVTSIAALDVALSVLFETEGYEERLERYRTCSGILRDGVERIDGVELLLDRDRMANTLTSVFLPDDVDLAAFIDELDRRGYIVYPGKGPFYDRGMFQIGNMGEIYPADCREFLAVLEDVLETMRE